MLDYFVDELIVLWGKDCVECLDFFVTGLDLFQDFLWLWGELVWWAWRYARALFLLLLHFWLLLFSIYFVFTLVYQHIGIFVFRKCDIIGSECLIRQIFYVKISHRTVIKFKPFFRLPRCLNQGIVVAALRRSCMNYHAFEFIFEILMR